LAGVFCPRCLCKVLLEQDGQSCSNCGRKLVIAAPAAPERKPPAGRLVRPRKRKPKA